MKKPRQTELKLSLSTQTLRQLSQHALATTPIVGASGTLACTLGSCKVCNE
jgi:hypothetical protein